MLEKIKKFLKNLFNKLVARVKGVPAEPVVAPVEPPKAPEAVPVSPTPVEVPVAPKKGIIERVRTVISRPPTGAVPVRYGKPVFVSCKSGQKIAYVIDYDVPVKDARGRPQAGLNQIQAHRTSGQPDRGGYLIEFNGKTSVGSLDATAMTGLTFKKGDRFFVTLTGEGVSKQAVTVY